MADACAPRVQFASDFDGDLHLFPKDLSEPSYETRWRVCVILADGGRKQVPITRPVMCVIGNEVSNPHGSLGHRKVAGWDVDFPNADRIEITVDAGEPATIRHPRP